MAIFNCYVSSPEGIPEVRVCCFIKPGLTWVSTDPLSVAIIQVVRIEIKNVKTNRQLSQPGLFSTKPVASTDIELVSSKTQQVDQGEAIAKSSQLHPQRYPWCFPKWSAPISLGHRRCHQATVLEWRWCTDCSISASSTPGGASWAKSAVLNSGKWVCQTC